MAQLTVLHLVFVYALCFGVQNKLTFLYGRAELLDRMLSCTYCLGFHCGWVTWLWHWLMAGKPPGEGWAIPASVVFWALVSAAWCYILDAVVRWLEGNTPAATPIPPPTEEE
jgi:hypothetical protein